MLGKDRATLPDCNLWAWVRYIYRRLSDVRGCSGDLAWVSRVATGRNGCLYERYFNIVIIVIAAYKIYAIHDMP